MPDYWLDANIFIESKKGPYAFDIAPGFWSFIQNQAGDGVIGSSSLVFDELVGLQDNLADWARAHRDLLFVAPDAAVQASLSSIADFVRASCQPRSAAEFLAKADPWIIAHARTYGGAVVTLEARVPANSSKAKIPNVCDHFNVTSISP